jgi:hypothetical protein
MPANNLFNGVLVSDPSTLQTLTFASSLTWNVGTFETAKVTLTGNLTSLTITNAVAGHAYILILTQDATGSRTATFGSSFKFVGGTAPVLTATANRTDVLCAFYDGVNFQAVLNNDFK